MGMIHTRCLVCGHEQLAPTWYLTGRAGRIIEDGRLEETVDQDVAVWNDSTVSVSCEEHSPDEVVAAYRLQTYRLSRISMLELIGLLGE
jgi:hypothetical protein